MVHVADTRPTVAGIGPGDPGGGVDGQRKGLKAPPPPAIVTLAVSVKAQPGIGLGLGDGGVGDGLGVWGRLVADRALRKTTPRLKKTTRSEGRSPSCPKWGLR